MKSKDWIYGIEVNMSYHPNLNGLKEITQDTWDTIVAKHGTDWLDMQGCLFNNVDFEPEFESDERVFKITNGNFKDSTFQNCRMDVTDFDHCNFKNVHYLDCKFTDAYIQNSNLESTYFSEPVIDACHFAGNNMTQSFFRAGEVKHTVFESNDMNKSYWDGTDIENDVTGRQNSNTDTIEIAVLGLEEAEEVQSYKADIETVFGQPPEPLKENVTVKAVEANKEIMENKNADTMMKRQENGNLYLNTPDLSGKENKEYRNRLKEAGAKYDPEKQDWYLPEGADPSKGQAVMSDIKNNWKPRPDAQSAAADAAENMQPYFKGFAYAQGQKNPSVFYGNSKEEILEKLNSYNQTRPENNRFQSCNIGQLDVESNSYQQFHKYNMEGKDISNIYLQIPHVERDEFLNITKQLKEAGAKFNPVKKQWYITGDMDLSRFGRYLPEQKPQPGTETAMQENDMRADQPGPEDTAAKNEAVSQDADWPEYQLSQHYTITFADGRDPVTVPITNNMDTVEEKEEMADKLIQAIENSQPPATKIQDLSEFKISQRDGVNSCTIYFKKRSGASMEITKAEVLPEAEYKKPSSASMDIAIEKEPLMVQVQDIKRAGYKPTNKLVKGMNELNMLSGRKLSLQEIAQLSKSPGILPDSQLKLVENIVKECQRQETARMMACACR